MNKIILTNPKYPHNVGGAVRAGALFKNVDEIIWTGKRFKLDYLKRLPREARLKAYKHIKISNNDKPFELLSGYVPVAVERRDHSENLYDFIHPEKAVYVFGPEDGSIPQSFLRLCHRFVCI